MNFPILPTALLQTTNVYQDIENANLLKVDYPNRPIRPRRPDSESPNEYRIYADLLEKYEAAMVEYNANRDVISKHNHEVDKLIEKYIKSVSGLNDIPEQYQKKVWEKAWSNGHSSGYYEVYGELLELVDIFE